MMKKLKPCPFCGHEVKVGSPEDWKPTFYDPDSGGEPYYFYCECGLNFWTNCYEYEDAVKTWNTRKPIDEIAEQLEEVSFVDIDEEYADDGQQMLFLYDAIEIVKGGRSDE